ncbi:hexokinase-like [Littorina saxatilis]|uniref:hexokinase-like n=1 Tax=Littorina saxatilis TaxID=31220 RepID=UPI0038B48D54
MVQVQVTKLKEDGVTLSVKPKDIKPVDKVVIEAKGSPNSRYNPSVTVKEVTGISIRDMRKLTCGDFAHLSVEDQTQTSQTFVLKPEKSGVAFMSATLNVKNVESLQAHCFFSGSTTGQQVAEQVTKLKKHEVTLSVKPKDIKPVDKVVIEAKGPPNIRRPPSVTVKEVTGIAIRDMRKLTCGDFAHLSAEDQTQTSQTFVLKPEESGVTFVSATLNVKNVESLQAHCFFSGSTTGQQVAEQVTKLKEDGVTLSVKPKDIKPVDKVVVEAKGPPNSRYNPSVTVKEVTGMAIPTGAFLVVDLSSMKLCIHLVRLENPGSISSPYCLEIRHTVRKGKELFDYIAKQVSDFAKTHMLEQKKFRLAFVFSFPCTYDSDFSNARLTQWTGEIDCDHVVGDTLKELFQEALQRNKVPDTIKVVTVVNDAVCMLVDATYGDPNCNIAVRLMDGFRACYRPVQVNQATEHSEKNIMQTELITINIGALGGGNSLKHIETQFDGSLDEDSLHSGQQTLGKMVSMMYVGELVRLVLVHLTEESLLFRTSPDYIHKLNKKNCLGTDEVFLIESDDNTTLPCTQFVLNKLQMNSNKEDRQTVRYVCKTVLKRAADLAAAGVATLINLLDVPEVSVAIEEDIDESHSEFLKHLEKRASELVNPKLKFKIVVSRDGIRSGAALLAAAVSPSFPNTAPTVVPSSASSSA